MRHYINNSSALRKPMIHYEGVLDNIPPKFGVPIKLGNGNKVKPTVQSTQENICLIHSFYTEMCETRCFIVIAFQSF
jgi:hypothetical protein